MLAIGDYFRMYENERGARLEQFLLPTIGSYRTPSPFTVQNPPDLFVIYLYRNIACTKRETPSGF